MNKLNIFVVGVGTIGGELINQIKDQKKNLEKNKGIKVSVIGIANSRKMIVQSGNELDLDNWQELLSNSQESFSIENYISCIKKLSLENSVFVDNTPTDRVPLFYSQLLESGISVVTCNKVICSGRYKDYNNLKEISKTNGTKFLYETNVGAGLPIISTIKDLVASGDEIVSMEAILSGSLNFIFNNYTSETTFYEVVKEAEKQGFTEPDPRLDLSGGDVARKILILAREIGVKIEIEDVQNNTFIPQEAMDLPTIEEFYQYLKKSESIFREKLDEANSKDCKLKFIASYANGKVSLGLKLVSKDHPFYNVGGKDNILKINTKRYSPDPLIIQGAGAGASVTAAGVFSDILKVSSKF